MDKKCKNCKHFSLGLTDRQRKEGAGTNWGLWADGICSLYFPRGYVDRKPPHLAHSTGKCFQWEEKIEK